jgi:hypothetical protein
MTTDTAAGIDAGKVRENRLRRVAVRQGLRLQDCGGLVIHEPSVQWTRAPTAGISKSSRT